MGALQSASPISSHQEDQFIMCWQSHVKYVGSSNKVEAQELKTTSKDSVLTFGNIEQGGHEDHEIPGSNSKWKDDQKDLLKDQKGH